MKFGSFLLAILVALVMVSMANAQCANGKCSLASRPISAIVQAPRSVAAHVVRTAQRAKQRVARTVPRLSVFRR